tara:strand:+ start:12974 stop:13186 length:213 start_codon:yes stop_codon:yes gene_type:complete
MGSQFVLSSATSIGLDAEASAIFLAASQLSDRHKRYLNNTFKKKTTIKGIIQIPLGRNWWKSHLNMAFLT